MRQSSRTRSFDRRPRRLSRVAGVLILISALAVGSRGAALALTAESGVSGAVDARELALDTFPIARSGVTYMVPFWSNGQLSRPDAAIRNVVITVHGDARNADDYGRYATESASLAEQSGTTVVIAPWFAAATDAPRSDQLYWSSSGWKQGDASISTGRAWTMSSFAVVDAMVLEAHRVFPNARINVTGHSAGGQFVQRYAAFAQQNVVAKYLALNPGSYLYLDETRWAGTTRRSLTSAEQKACPKWNTFKYGLARRSGAVALPTESQVRQTYRSAPVAYVLGELDTGLDSGLDTSCAANWEGKNRLERGRNFYTDLTRTYGDAVRSHSLVTVPGVAHSAGRMIRSSQVRALLFP